MPLSMLAGAGLAAWLAAAVPLVPAAIDRAIPGGPDARVPMTLQDKRASVQPLVSRATECIARAVSTDPRFADQMKTGNVNDLIVDSVPSCLEAVRGMIDAYDRAFGQGSGESFFVGPYLDALPAAVNALVKGSEAGFR